MQRSDSFTLNGTGPWLPLVIGHRGAAGEAPENTLAGLRRAHAVGCKWVEFDVRMTADGELILLHDDRLERTTDGRGKARKLSLAAIRRFDAGAWFDPQSVGEPVPTLCEVIAVLSELGLGANIELKSERGRRDNHRAGSDRPPLAIMAETSAGAADFELFSRGCRGRSRPRSGSRSWAAGAQHNSRAAAPCGGFRLCDHQCRSPASASGNRDRVAGSGIFCDGLHGQ